jgi:hypothetical protein
VITFKQFFVEMEVVGTPPHRKPIDPTKAMEMIIEHAPASLKHKDQPLWRGMSGTGEAYIINPAESGRKSANTWNYYTMIFDHLLPEEFPRRGKSIIAANTANLGYAGSFASNSKDGKNRGLYAIFPYDDTKIGTTLKGRYDIWGIPVQIGDEQLRLNHWNDIFKEAGLSETDYDDFVMRIEEIISNEDAPQYQTFIDLFTPGEVDEQIRKAYVTDLVGTHLAARTGATIGPEAVSRDDAEMWIGGPCIAVRHDVYDDMVKDL